MNPPFPSEPGAPVVSTTRRRPSLVWLVPTVAAVIGLSMLLHAWLSSGPTITISFMTASGLEAGKTPVKYKDVTVGVVSAIDLSPDGSRVMATVQLDQSAASLARVDSRFWVVRPRIGLGGVSGIDTLLSGAYIGVDKGTGSATGKRFVGLETPPTVTHGSQGRSFVLRAKDLGSIDIGSPVYFRRIQVGQVASYRLAEDGREVDLQVFVNAPYDRFVTAATRFWNASGVDVSLGADGLKLNTQSLATVMAGGIAFATLAHGGAEVRAASGAVYDLAKDEKEAMASTDGPAQFFQLVFEHSLRGLVVGAPVEFFGQSIGEVASVRLDYAPDKQKFVTAVGISVYPNRLGRVLEKLPKSDGDAERRTARFLAGMVAQGLRAQARSGNLLTGQLYISLDFLPRSPPANFDVDARPLVLPTVNGDLDQMQQQVASIVSKLDKLPLESIGQHVDASLKDLDEVLRQLHGQVLPQATQSLQQVRSTLGAAQGLVDPQAPLQQNIGQALEQVQRAARSLREFLDMLNRHPESLLRGRPASSAPPVAAPTDDIHPSQASRTVP
ncbi:MlaD family protein [Luteibacter sp. PPL552]